MNRIPAEEALNTISWLLYSGIPVIAVLLIWIGITLRGLKRELMERFPDRSGIHIVEQKGQG